MKIVAYIFAYHHGRSWLFEKTLPPTQVVPCIGMDIVDWNGTGEDMCIEGIEWHPRINEVRLRLADDRWADSVVDDTPPENYAKYGWTLMD